MFCFGVFRAKTRIIRDSVVLSENVNSNLEKYAISNAMALSVHLGSFEANLEQYIETMEPVTEVILKNSFL